MKPPIDPGTFTWTAPALPEWDPDSIALPTATLHEAAGKTGALPSAIKPIAPTMRIAGPAVTVHCPPGDNLWIHRAIYEAKPGDVLVVSVSQAFEHGYWGEIMTAAAMARKLGGLVIDGCVRDRDLLEEAGFPVFARGICIRGTGKDFGAVGWINAPVLIGDQTVRAGDLIVGDRDGVVCIARDRVSDVLVAARERERQEQDIVRRLEAGECTLDIYGWRIPAQSTSEPDPSNGGDRASGDATTQSAEDASTDTAAYLAELEDIPGTRIFTAARARKGYWLNQFAMSLMKPENRERWKANEAAYLAEWQLSDEQKQAVLDRDFNRMLDLGGNIYFLVKISSTDGISVAEAVSTMTDMSFPEYRAMMDAGGRSPEGLRSIREKR